MNIQKNKINPLMYEFCPCCDSLLLITKINNQTSYKCENCEFYHPISSISHKVYFNKQKHEKIIWQDDILKSMAKCEKECNKCGNMQASFYELQTRSADEPMTIFYQCISCKNTWKE